MSQDAFQNHYDKLVRENNEANLPYTSRLPDMDEVELQCVEGYGSTITKVVEAKKLAGTGAKTFAEVWRAQKFDDFGARCHFPAYAAKFYVNGQVYVYASVCRQCDNIYFYQEDSATIQGFEAKGKEGQTLLQLFKQTQPEEWDRGSGEKE